LCALQLFIEGNNRTGSLIASWINLYAGYPPFVLLEQSAVDYFAPSAAVKQFANRSCRLERLAEHDPAKSYRVQLDAPSFCTCPDSQRRPGQECKHSLAAVMVARALVGLERHPLFDQPVAATSISEAPVVNDNVHIVGWQPVDGHTDLATLGRMPRAERED
jgi:hypothetical protein